MEQAERAVVLDPAEVSTEQGGEAPATAVLDGEVAGAEEVDSSVLVAAAEGVKKQDLEVPSSESGDKVAAASGGVDIKDRGVFEDPVAACSGFRAATAEVPVLGVPSSSAPAPVTGTHEDAPAMADGDHGAAPGDDDKKLNKRACYAPGATVAIAHASPPDSYRRAPSRSRKQPLPEHFIPAEAEATVRAKARRTGIALDGFITSVLRSYSAKNVTASRPSGLGTRATTPPAPAGCEPRSAASEPPAAARSPPRQRRRGASPEGEEDSTASTARPWRLEKQDE